MKISAYLIIIFSIVAILISAINIFNVATHPIKYQSLITKYAVENNLDCELIASLINTESSFKENAKSNKNAIGLMQIKLSTANYVNELNKQNPVTENDLYNPETNIRIGCEYLRYLINKFEDINTSLAAYNAGETRVRIWLNSEIYSVDGKSLSYIPYKETREYVNKINNSIKTYKKYFKN